MTLAGLDDIERLYAARGGAYYGEGVSQTEHALQCAALAEAAGASAALIAAALLHDVGHLLEEAGEAARVDLRHEATGARALEPLFGDQVSGPIALHVAAKRYLCLAEPAYFDALSPASKHTLALQGGAYDARQAAAFQRAPHWRAAVALRRLDEAGKSSAPCGRALADFTPLLRALLVRGRA